MDDKMMRMGMRLFAECLLICLAAGAGSLAVAHGSRLHEIHPYENYLHENRRLHALQPTNQRLLRGKLKDTLQITAFRFSSFCYSYKPP